VDRLMYMLMKSLSIKKKRKVIILLEEVEVFYYLDSGISIAAVRYHHHIKKLMFPFMKKNEHDQGKE
jgi:hypothetical protein